MKETFKAGGQSGCVLPKEGEEEGNQMMMGVL